MTVSEIGHYMTAVVRLREALRKALDAERVLFEQYDDDPGELMPEWLQREAASEMLDWYDTKARWRLDLNERAALFHTPTDSKNEGEAP